MTNDLMREEINEIPQIIEKFSKCFSDNLEKISMTNYSDIWITGSGDSQCASVYLDSLLSQLGLISRVFVPMELSNFFKFTKSRNPCLIAISVSGKTPRVIEVVKKFKSIYHNSPVIGLTDNPNSVLHKEANIPLLLNASPPESLVYNKEEKSIVKEYDGYQNPIPQTKTFYSNLLYLTSLAFKLVGRENDLKKLLNLIQKQSKQWITTSELEIKEIKVLHPQKTIFIGSSLFKSLAQFGSYKWFEFTFPGMYQDIEEYAHTHYFTTDSDTTLIFFIPNQIHFTRIKELFDGALMELVKPQIISFVGKINFDEYKRFPNVSFLNFPEKNSFDDRLLQEIYFYFYQMIEIFWLMYYTAHNEGLDTNRFRGGKDVQKYIKGSLQTIRNSKINL
ncbi:MAG: SIS domain-containing protein [Candidatus Thorarchaeota archaeon]